MGGCLRDVAVEMIISNRTHWMPSHQNPCMQYNEWVCVILIIVEEFTSSVLVKRYANPSCIILHANLLSSLLAYVPETNSDR